MICEEDIVDRAVEHLLSSDTRKRSLFSTGRGAAYATFVTSRHDPLCDLVVVCVFCETTLARIARARISPRLVFGFGDALFGSRESNTEELYVKCEWHSRQCALEYWSKLP